VLVVVGGGAGGVELALSLAHRLEQERAAAGQPEGLRAQVRWVARGSGGAAARQAGRQPAVRRGAQ
jgi:NADH dehydrogenase FAD-containing subunit